MATESRSKVISSYDDLDYVYYSATNLSNGYAGSDSTTYAQINLVRGINAVSYIYWQFPAFSEIPSNATIDSVTCTCKCSISSTSTNYIATRQARLYSGTTAMGSNKTVANSTTAFTITAGTWTRAQLQDPKLRLYAVRGTQNTNTNYYFRFYGATLTVTYTYQDTKFKIRVKQNGSWVSAKKVFVKRRDVWEPATRVFGKLSGTWKESK